MQLSRNYSVFNDKLLPKEVVHIYVQQAVPESSAAAHLTFQLSVNENDSGNTSEEVAEAVQQLLEKAAHLQIEHNFSFDFILSMLEKLIKTKEFKKAKIDMTICASIPPTLVIEWTPSVTK